MTDFTALLSQGVTSAWLFIPSAVLLGALHGLEPGHSKTMMAAFIVAIRGSVKQAVLLGLAATVSHTMVVWLIALGGMTISHHFTAQAAEPWLQTISGVIILVTAIWMGWRTWSEAREWHQGREPHQHDESLLIDTGHGKVQLAIDESAGPAYWVFTPVSGHQWQAESIQLETRRPDGSSQQFTFHVLADQIRSRDVIPEPHEFNVTLMLGHGDHQHRYDLHFHEHHHSELADLEQGSAEYQDAHERAHADDIRRRFDGREVTNGQILLFGLTGGLIPCPAAITVLLLCIQVKQFSLGAALVICFSVGLALTLVTVGVGAALSVRHVSRRWSGFEQLARRAPYLSSGLIALVGLYMGWHGLHGLI
ncbi:nickel/cobalt efflux protein RcnA [Candidatus Pantoea multigeneris]|uniref:Nickel/cobalt efflux system n=1 Tax=Candidatus Pantoea multigeneris TaxID=2608357 RepID=A0ABX0RD20_9GAMM|nr:nickel/cobalt efflux protein RcnA [Pantoea multigeneris]NIF22211.1 nickel/cobalt efflux protein RcnA [Pantoea multigeneris]